MLNTRIDFSDTRRFSCLNLSNQGGAFLFLPHPQPSPTLGEGVLRGSAGVAAQAGAPDEVGEGEKNSGEGEGGGNMPSGQATG